ncbi:hypothetical protein BDV41DRAFT_152913 [Aspergillus transmontanensis]|uniref:Uncharacterized protein n=1 Tax=Aspergillus transmontanensis TaxID=1034304 RepID=A0A5N6W5B5_9EURO|nr:hypothetical protein BDV41DRAFT_152913 [Aspergillus transmontanensis]
MAQSPSAVGFGSIRRKLLAFTFQSTSNLVFFSLLFTFFFSFSVALTSKCAHLCEKKKKTDPIGPPYSHCRAPLHCLPPLALFGPGNPFPAANFRSYDPYPLHFHFGAFRGVVHSYSYLAL